MEEAEKTICPVDTGREAQASVSFELHQTREVCVWIPKCRAHEARISKALSHRRDIQQREVRVSFQRHKTCAFMPERGTHEVRVSQVSPDKRDNQQRKVASLLRKDTRPTSQSQNTRAASVLQNVNSASLNLASLGLASRGRDVRLAFALQQLRSEGSRKVLILRDSRLVSSNPPLTDLRDYLTKKMSVHQIAPLCCCERLITTVLSECHCSRI